MSWQIIIEASLGHTYIGFNLGKKKFTQGNVKNLSMNLSQNFKENWRRGDEFL